jgi:4-amino-4-deoxy-L-arabinose transferase-like glycosyltransferase
VALLAISPYFADHARRCMMDMALGFWVALFFLLTVEGLAHPRRHALLAIPLGAAILTKSLLGLLPLAVFGGCALVSATYRRPLRNPWWWCGVLLGLGIGAAWTVDQTLRYGPGVLRAHYFDQVGGQVMKPLRLWRHLVGFPIHLLERFQPAILPGLAGMVLLVRRVKMDPRLWLLILWWLLPLLVYIGLGAQEARYLFPLFPPIVICAAWAVQSLAPTLALWVRRGVAPATLAAAALWLWIAPPAFVNQADHAFAAQRAWLQSRIPPDEPLTYLARPDGAWYWPAANPLMYYDERLLERPAATVEEAMTRVLTRRSHLLLCDREMVDKLPPVMRHAWQPMAGRSWVLLDLGGSSAP